MFSICTGSNNLDSILGGTVPEPTYLDFHCRNCLQTDTCSSGLQRIVPGYCNMDLRGMWCACGTFHGPRVQLAKSRGNQEYEYHRGLRRVQMWENTIVSYHVCYSSTSPRHGRRRRKSIQPLSLKYSFLSVSLFPLLCPYPLPGYP